MLLRWRTRCLEDQIRGPIISDQIGPTPNITSGLRKSRYPSRPAQSRDSYSSTVSVITSPVPRRSRSPAVPWWTAWLCPQLANGWKTSRPANRPTHLFPRFVGMNEPWVQSWKTMKVRSRKPAAGIARARVIQTETSSEAYISTVRAR